MNRKKQRRTSTSTSSGDDELAVVKAAAWAWYQRASGNQGKPFRESEAAAFPARLACRPSRFKLEIDESELLQRSDPEPGGSEKSLLDVYEVERITRQIERLVMATADERDRMKKRDKGTIRTKGMVKRVNGFWMRHAIGICGTHEAVVEAHVLSRPARARK